MAAKAGWLARVVLPSSVTRLVLFLNNDSGGRRAEALARGFQRRARPRIEARYPELPGADWNDVLLQAWPTRCICTCEHRMNFQLRKL